MTFDASGIALSSTEVCSADGAEFVIPSGAIGGLLALRPLNALFFDRYPVPSLRLVSPSVIGHEVPCVEHPVYLRLG